MEHAQRKTRPHVVFRHGRVAATLLSHPNAEAVGRGGEDGIFGVNQDLGVLFGGHLADEKIVVADGSRVMGNESFIPVKQLFTIRKIPADTHEGMTVEGRRKVEQSVLERIEAHEAVQGAFLLDERTVANDDFRIVAVAVHHATQPLVVGWHTVEVGEDDNVVLGRFYAHRQRELLAVEEVKVLLQLHGLDSWLQAFKVFQVFLGVVVGTVVHHNDFKIRVVLVEQHRNQFNKVLIGIAGAEHNGNGFQLLVEFRSGVPFVEGHLRKQAPMIEHLDDPTKAKHN